MEKSKEEMALEELTALVQKEGIKVEMMGVAMVGQEQFIGEVQEVTRENGVTRMVMVNPKRYLRLQQVQPNNFRVDFLIIDLDVISAGKVTVIPQAYYLLSDLDVISRIRMLALYRRFLDDKVRARAAEAGIQLAGPGEMPKEPPRA